MLPQLRELETRFPDVLAVVGVHSGKYIAERVTARIREAALRLGAHHPIVNDRQFRIWRAYAVRAWPTIALLDPDGYVVGMHAGEISADALAPVLERVLAGARDAGTLRPQPLADAPEASAMAPGALRYPGKVAADGRRLAVADTGHHRVLVGTVEGGPGVHGRRLRVGRTLGDGVPGTADGARARWLAPQGMVFDGARLYVADAEAHTVRIAELETGVVRTLAGTGRQARTQRDLDEGALSSPWDLAFADGELYVAMAGLHQLWAVSVTTGRGRVHAGTGAEDIADGSLGEALLAQPMGIDGGDGRLWFVDPESSAVRWADAGRAGRVETLVGTGLFDFGDKDGVGDAVRLQHPQGVARRPDDGWLLVADSYNDALKWLDPATRAVRTWSRGFHEPAGVTLAGNVAYVADTNAHRVMVADLRTAEVAELAIELPGDD